MFTTKVTLRFAAGLPRASTRIPIAFGSVTTSRQSVIRPFLIARRTFATPGRPKKGSVGESSPRARKTVKKDATTKPSNKAVKTTSKTSTTKKPSATAEKKAAASKARVAREQARKAKEREKAAAKKLREKQRADKKKAATKKPKKVLTPEQKAAATAKLAKSNLAALKKQALSPPPITKGTAWVVYFSEKAKELKGSLAGGSVIDKMGAKVKEAAAEYKNLSPADMEHYNHIANQAKAKSEADYSAWVLSHTPDQIRLANAARSQLSTKSRQAGKHASPKWGPIKDDRLLARPVSPFLIYYTERCATGDFKHIGVPERARLMSAEWKALSESDKQKYKDELAKQTAQYEKDYVRVYGHERPSRGKKTATADS